MGNGKRIKEEERETGRRRERRNDGEKKRE